MNQEEMEQELWRLRAVEIDLQRSHEQVCSLDREAEKHVTQIASLEASLNDRQRQLQSKQSTIDALSRLAKELEEMLEKATHERDWAMERLEENERAEYMHNAYGIHVTDKMPTDDQARRRGWRLSR